MSTDRKNIERDIQSLSIKLELAKEQTARAFGTDDILYQLIDRALTNGGFRELHIALDAYDNQSQELREKLGPLWSLGPNVSEEDSEIAARLGKPLRLVLQIDGFDVGKDNGDDVMRPDENGHCLMSTMQLEPKQLDTAVRIHILAGTSKETAALMLQGALRWIENGWESLIYEDRSLPGQRISVHEEIPHFG